jgi:hypothetical protein
VLVWRVVKECHGGDPETRSLLAADVVGFSKLAGSDEERTLARLRALRSDLIDPTIALHNGRIVKRTGDGVLIEFRRRSRPAPSPSRAADGQADRCPAARAAGRAGRCGGTLSHLLLHRLRRQRRRLARARARFGANHHLRQSLVFLNVPAMQQPETYIGGTDKQFAADGKLANEGTRKFLQDFMHAFSDWITAILDLRTKRNRA